MVMSGIRRGKNKRNGVISVAPSSGNPSSVQTLFSQCNILRTRSGREIMRDGGADVGSSIRKRHWKRKSTPRFDEKEKNVFPKRARCGRRKRPLCRGKERGWNEDLSRKRSILSWLIESGTLPPDAQLSYRDRDGKKVLKNGRITKDGLLCNCCHKLFTTLEFEKHAGSTLNDPFRNIHLDTGVNLLKCQIAAWNQQNSYCSLNMITDKNKEDTNDDTCGTCGDGGDLICCDGCTSTYHQSCLGIEDLPPGDWICEHCKCKYCRLFEYQPLYPPLDPPLNPILTCLQCEKRFHKNCNTEVKFDAFLSKGFGICGRNCWMLFRRLQDILGFNNPLGNGYSWTLNKRLVQIPNEHICRQTRRLNCKARLAIALKVMRECFDPIIDPRSGVDIVQSVIYNVGSNLKRLDLIGFYTATLERGDEIVSAASIRIHGTRLAEMPFIGTRIMYRRQGMCRRLFQAIESTLIYLGVEKLILPSIEERVEKWKTEYNFQPIGEALWQEMKSMNMLPFPGTVLLEKNILLPRQEVLKANAGVHCKPPLFDLNQLPPSSDQDDLAQCGESSAIERNN